MIDRTKHCWQNYVDYHKCILAKGEDFAPCRQVYLVEQLTDLYTKILAFSSSLHTGPFALVHGVSAGMINEVIESIPLKAIGF